MTKMKNRKEHVHNPQSTCGGTVNTFTAFPQPNFHENKPKTKTKAKTSKATEGTFTDPRDGKEYKTVKIGEQVWMAENLNFDCPGAKCYGNDPKNAKKYGRLYNWETAMEVCPPGWHLPSNEEWKTLVDFAGGYEIAGKTLKAKSGWNSYMVARETKSGNGTDDFGFSALPGGCGYSGSEAYVGQRGYWWSSSESVDYVDDAYRWFMRHKSEFVDCIEERKSNRWISVRCIQDTDPRDGKQRTTKIKEEFLEDMQEDASVLKDIPEKFKTYEFYLRAVEEGQHICGGNELVIEHVPEEFKTPELCLKAINRFSTALRYIPKSLKTPKFYLRAVTENGSALAHVPEKFKSFKLCLAATLCRGDTDVKDILCYVPKKLRAKVKATFKTFKLYLDLVPLDMVL